VLKPHFDACVHVDNIGLRVPAKDVEIWEYARKNDMVIVTNDEDFFKIFSIKGFPPKVIMLRMGNQSRKDIEQILISLKNRIADFVNATDYGVLEFI
jgi:predicted nuclease of predicted toxin-antitoxin system